jgi:8-oxo-dGTP diphosphatase
MAILLIRHAKAGDREEWSGEDSLRPLSKPGRRQAEGLVDSLKAFRVARVLSSPSVRCVQTVEPMAKARGLAVEGSDALAEGAGAKDAIILMRELEDDAVLCTHGDVLWYVIRALTKRQADTPKGGGWVIEVGDRGPRLIRAIPPPSSD